MYLNKFFHSANFEYPQSLTPQGGYSVHRKKGALTLTQIGKRIFRLTATGQNWNRNESCWAPYPDGIPEQAGSSWQTLLDPAPLSLRIENSKKKTILETVPGQAFGVCADSWVMNFMLDGSEHFYGMGEKFLGLELSETATSFWNTDMMGDFPPDLFKNGRPDPAYVSIPWLIVETKGGWVGILVNNPGRVMMNTGAQMKVEGLLSSGDQNKMLMIAAEQGQPDVYFLYGKTLRDLTCDYQQLVGTTPRPPVWSLGYHQCRWGYRSAAELEGYKQKFKQAEFPVDGLWLDIDYMDGYRVFTFHDEHFPNVEADLASLQSDGQHVVPILDPGVKIDPDWEVFTEGLDRDVYCKTPQGQTFVGQVWPGDTAFVDYNLKKGQTWWTEKTAEFAAKGIRGCWNDMNDPSLGFVDNQAMKFGNGKKPHWTGHNQFAYLMADATRQGFLQAHPEERPFVLSRSGSTGMARVAALWHGDSTANYHWLQLTLPTALNLSLSGVPFNGGDLGGFDGDTSAQLLIDYTKACFLFPFCRNHASFHSARQEPWVFGEETFELIRGYVRDRYRLRPYLYNLFLEHERSGEAVLRPLFYDFNNRRDLDFSKVEDQFMIGPALMQAPLVTEERRRSVLLPEGPWWDFMKGKWIRGGRKISLTPEAAATPVYGREGAAVPMETERPVSHHWNGSSFDLHLFMKPGSGSRIKGILRSDDGHSFAYREGKQSELQYTAVEKDGTLRIRTRQTEKGYGEIQTGFVLYGKFNQVTVNGKAVKTRPGSYEFAGCTQRVQRVAR